MAQGIIEALCHDHDQVRHLFDRVENASGERKQELFRQLVSDLVQHELAEEEVLRPVSKRDAGERIVTARLKEESEAETLLKAMERLDVSSPKFGTQLARLRQKVEKHAEAEESKEFPRIESKESTERLQQMATAYEMAKKVALTHPHPNRPDTPPANVMTGPLAAAVDRARDALQGLNLDNPD